VRTFGGCAGDREQLFSYARSLRRLPLYLVLAAQPPNNLNAQILKKKVLWKIYACVHKRAQDQIKQRPLVLAE
jgi:hypothetical protein